jgi:hypothetical protein
MIHFFVLLMAIRGSLEANMSCSKPGIFIGRFSSWRGWRSPARLHGCGPRGAGDLGPQAARRVAAATLRARVS